MAEFPAPESGILLAHFIVSDDVERSRRFYTEVLGGKTIRSGEPTYVTLRRCRCRGTASELPGHTIA